MGAAEPPNGHGESSAEVCNPARSAVNVITNNFLSETYIVDHFTDWLLSSLSGTTHLLCE